MPSPFLAGLGAALFAGGSHWIAHVTFGEEAAFEDAGVQRAGLTVMLAAFLIGWGAARFQTLGSPNLQFVEAALVSIVVLIGAVLVLNRGNPIFVNVLAQVEPAIIAAGVFTVLFVGGPLGWIAGVVLVGIGLASRFSGRFNLNLAS